MVGVPVSIGIGETKTLAKLANREAKKKYRDVGVYIIDSEGKRIAALKGIKVTDIWGIGRRIGKRLNDVGVYNAHELSMVDEDWAKRQFSVVLQRAFMNLKS